MGLWSKSVDDMERHGGSKERGKILEFLKNLPHRRVVKEVAIQGKVRVQKKHLDANSPLVKRLWRLIDKIRAVHQERNFTFEGLLETTSNKQRAKSTATVAVKKI
jgi:diadenosine tetraphosphatase ApaH/serine/threonine PP2A family protein phosphatase